MNIPDTFAGGLEVTAWGMGIVFGALIIVMGCIYLLGKIFPYKEEEEEATSIPMPAPAVLADDSDIVAALAVALVASMSTAPTTLKPAASLADTDYEEIQGEVVTVAMINPGPDNWGKQGRLNATL